MGFCLGDPRNNYGRALIVAARVALSSTGLLFQELRSPLLSGRPVFCQRDDQTI